MKKSLYILLLLIIAVVVVFLVFPQWLLYTVIEDPYLPTGTLITWIGFIAWNEFFYQLSAVKLTSTSKGSLILKSLFKIVVLISYVWGFLGYLIANNWSMTFSGSISTFRGSYNASLVYWGLNYFLISTPVLLFFTILIFKRLKRL